MQLAIVGTGYVGLITGVCLSARGHDVTGVDVSVDVVDSLNKGKPHIYERHLGEILSSVLAAGRFRATTNLAAALDRAELVMIAVGTPSVDGAIDLRHVRDCARAIGQQLSQDANQRSIVVKSTVLPGTTDDLVRAEIEAASGLRFGQFGLGMNPEFLREGDAVDDFMEADRIVLGYEDDRTLQRLQNLYAMWDCDKLCVNTRTAELIKYANNVILATQISTMNEIANLASAIGSIDVMDVVRGVQLDARWSPVRDGHRITPDIVRYLVPGCGFGGSCFPKDVQALRACGSELGLPMAILGAVLAVNEAQPQQVIDILIKEVPDLDRRTCLVLGLAFKPETDDVRESASVKIVRGLARRSKTVLVHDPVAATNFARALAADARLVSLVDGDWQSAVRTSDVIVVATAWNEYRALAELDLTGKVLFDARRMFRPSELAGARYLAIGRRL
jgi:UDPglucose 6-dehydrogenase/GDP-mannose 6-dehydrogenase